MADRTTKRVKNWELYTCSMKCGRAERALDAVLERGVKELVKRLKAANAMSDDAKTVGTIIERVRHEVMYPVMQKYSSYGALDSEPYYHAGQGLIQGAKEYFHISPEAKRYDWGDYL